jgi:hypothetical protein
MSIHYSWRQTIRAGLQTYVPRSAAMSRAMTLQPARNHAAKLGTEIENRRGCPVNGKAFNDKIGNRPGWVARSAQCGEVIRRLFLRRPRRPGGLLSLRLGKRPRSAALLKPSQADLTHAAERNWTA